MGDVVTHDAWAERIAEYDRLRLDGPWAWSFGGDVGGWLISPDGERVAAVTLNHIVGIVAALNTAEGRAAHARHLIEDSPPEIA